MKIRRWGLNGAPFTTMEERLKHSSLSTIPKKDTQNQAPVKRAKF